MTRTSTARGMIIAATVAFAAVMVILAAAYAEQTDRIGWRAVWALVTGGIASVLALAMWRLDRVFELAAFFVAALATVGLGASVPAIVVSVLAMGDGSLVRPDSVAFDLVFGMACACYLAFALVGLVSRASGDSAGLLPPRPRWA